MASNSLQSLEVYEYVLCILNFILLSCIFKYSILIDITFVINNVILLEFKILK